jgi:Domain of unknown function (DU1801)
MAANKTSATDASVANHIASIANEVLRKDCMALVKMFRTVTKFDPKMWGPSIIGFGSYHYKYESGREGDMCLTGFAVRSNELVVYLTASSKQQEALLAKLGKHRMGKACLYIRGLKDIDAAILETLISDSVAEVKRRYG